MGRIYIDCEWTSACLHEGNPHTRKDHRDHQESMAAVYDRTSKKVKENGRER
jgi:hypothetical protein